MSFLACPGWLFAMTVVAATSAVAAIVAGATPRGRPMHQPASRASPSQARLSTGESRSRPNRTMPTPWISSLLAGKNETPASRTYCRPVTEPCWAKRPANGMWYQTESYSCMPRWSEPSA